MSQDLQDAVRLYRTFHQFEPHDIGEFHRDFKIPAIGRVVGQAECMYYRSDKLNPESGEDEGCIDYVHEHGPRVKVLRFGDQVDGLRKAVPRWLRARKEFVLVGMCLGFRYRALSGELIDANATAPFPDWYASRCGRALLVVSHRRQLDAVFIGGSLRVTARGVVG